jgi:hypothetical protein
MGPGEDKLQSLVDKRFGRISKYGGKIPAGKKSTHRFAAGRKDRYGISICRHDATDQKALLAGQLGKRLKEPLHFTLYHIANLRFFQFFIVFPAEGI